MDRREPAILDTTSPGAHTQSIDPSPPAAGITFGDNPPAVAYGLDMTNIKVHTKFKLKPYDPVAVLEAMREAMNSRWDAYGFGLGVFDGDDGKWRASFPISQALGVEETFPDFPSAVRWLHRQAAAVDPAFAEQWPVPE